jgi:hypothetical protein
VHEDHQREQYFFDPDTVRRLADFAQQFELPCCLCTPFVGRELVERGVETRILDSDERFAELPGFRRYDLYRPEHTGERYGVILCDPPFFNVSLAQLFSAVRLLADFDWQQPLLIAYLARRSAAITGTFAPFTLQETAFRPKYLTVPDIERNEIAGFSNMAPAPLAPLFASHDE